MRTEAGPIAIVGMGGLGCPAALALGDWSARERRPLALLLVDGDVVDPTNLHRQVLFGAGDVGRPKVEVAHARLAERFPRLRIETRRERLAGEALAALAGLAALVIDGTDDPATKLALNDACVARRRPLVHAGVIGLGGHALAVVPGSTPCVHCLWGDLPDLVDEAAPTCATAGVLGPVAGVVGALAGEAAIAMLAGRAPGPALVRYDLRTGLRGVAIRRRADCPCCSNIDRLRGGDDGHRPHSHAVA